MGVCVECTSLLYLNHFFSCISYRRKQQEKEHSKKEKKDKKKEKRKEKHKDKPKYKQNGKELSKEEPETKMKPKECQTESSSGEREMPFKASFQASKPNPIMSINQDIVVRSHFVIERERERVSE
jgi:hypothetical protein